MSPVSRRIFLRDTLLLGTVGVLSPILAACQSSTSAPAPGNKAAEPTAPAKSNGAPAATNKPAGQGSAEVNVLAAEWVIKEWKLPDWVAEYNGMGASKVNVEQAPEDFVAKVQAMVRSGDVLYDGIGIMTPFIGKVQWAESGLIQPVDAFIKSSSSEGAADIVGDWVPTIKQDITYKGQTYGIPYSVEAIGLMWFTEPLKTIGYEEGPATWDDTIDAARKVREQFKQEQITAIGWNNGIHTSIQGLIHTATKTPYTDEGLIDITGEAGIKAVTFLQNLFKEGLTPPHGSDGIIELWERAKLGMFLAQNSRGVWAQRVHGPDKAATGKLPLPAQGAVNAGSPFWSNTFTVVNKAKQPQALVDFYVWLLGPKNTQVHQAIIESGKAPVLDSIYDSLVKPNKQFAWMALHRDMIADSVPYPENTFWSIQNTKIMPWIAKLLEKDTTLTPEEAMNNALNEVKDEVAKQKVQ